MLRCLGRRWMYRLIYRLVEEAVAKVERKSPESDRQANQTFVVSMGPSYSFPLVIQVPCMQSSLATVLDGLLYL